MRLARALAVDHEVAGNAIQPGADLCAVGFPAERLFSEPQQGFLCDVLRLYPIAQPVLCKRHDRCQMTVRQCRPGGLIAGRGATYKFVIRDIAQIVGHVLYTRPFRIWVNGVCGFRVRVG